MLGTQEANYRTVYGLYIINDQRTSGSTTFYENEWQANSMLDELLPGWWGYVESQTFEPEYED